MSEASDLAITIRRAVAQDAGGITRVYMESAEHHARLEPDRFWIPAAEEIETRYRESDPPSAYKQEKAGSPALALSEKEGSSSEEAVTLVAEVHGEITGFLEARLESSPDPMHRELLYCH